MKARIPALLLACLLLVSGLTLSGTVRAAEWKTVWMTDPPTISEQCPYGKFIVVWEIKKLMNDGDSTWDWFLVDIRFQSQPGIMVVQAQNEQVCPDSPWRQSRQWEEGAISGVDASTYIVEYGPTTTVGSTSLGFTIGGSIPAGLSLGFSISYSIADVIVFDKSQLEQKQVFWEHEMVPRGSPNYKVVSYEAYLSHPAFLIRAAEADSFQVHLDHRISVGYWSGTTWNEAWLSWDHDWSASVN